MRLVLLLLILIVGTPGFAAKKSPFYPLSVRHQQSILFQRLSDGKIIFAANPDNLLIPASISKLIIAAAALKNFTPAHRFNTIIYHSGRREGAKIHGNLYFKGDGDPMLINEKLWQMAADLHHMGIRSITGDIVIDATVFDRKEFDVSRGRSKYISSNAYNAPVSGMGVNFNTFPIAIAPAPSAKSPALMNIDPFPINGITLKNRISTIARGVKRLKITRSFNGKATTVSGRGAIPIDNELTKVYRAVSDPTLSGGEIIRSFLQNAGISVAGTVREGKTPTKLAPLYVIESYEMSRIISGLNKYSNNYIADVLLKNLGANFSHPQRKVVGTFANGLDVISSFLDKNIKVTPGYKLYNGSGLDPRNQLSARQVVKVLQYMFRHMDVFPEFLASLPAAGWDGTLEDRFQKNTVQKLQGMVRAKTGSLSQPVVVSSLAGYLGHPEHGMIAFAIIENGIAREPQPSILDFRARQDLALQKIVENF